MTAKGHTCAGSEREKEILLGEFEIWMASVNWLVVLYRYQLPDWEGYTVVFKEVTLL